MPRWRGLGRLGMMRPTLITPAAVPLSGGSGGTGPLPQQASAPIAAREPQTSDDYLSQHTDLDRTFHGGEFK